jgi:hypothetical protein
MWASAPAFRRDCLVECLPGTKCVLEPVHVHPLTTELNPFHLQACSLFLGGFVAKFDSAAGAKHSMPRQKVWRIGAQQPCHCAMVKRIAGCCRNAPISAHLSGGNGQNDATKRGVTKFVGPCTIPQDLAPYPRTRHVGGRVKSDSSLRVLLCAHRHPEYNRPVNKIPCVDATSIASHRHFPINSTRE